MRHSRENMFHQTSEFFVVFFFTQAEVLCICEIFSMPTICITCMGFRDHFVIYHYIWHCLMSVVSHCLGTILNVKNFFLPFSY